jgi:hypothetical protein
VKLAILLVSRDVAVCVAEEGNRLPGERGELIHTRRTERVLGFIQHRKKPVAVYDFERMARSIGVGAHVV